MCEPPNATSDVWGVVYILRSGVSNPLELNTTATVLETTIIIDIIGQHPLMTTNILDKPPLCINPWSTPIELGEWSEMSHFLSY